MALSGAVRCRSGGPQITDEGVDFGTQEKEELIETRYNQDKFTVQNYYVVGPFYKRNNGAFRKQKG